MPFITQVLHVPQVLLSAYGLYVSYISITNLRQYEEKSEKAAEWSSAAEHQLHKTRTTQASGAITVSLHIYSPPPALLVYVYMHFCVCIYVYMVASTDGKPPNKRYSFPFPAASSSSRPQTISRRCCGSRSVRCSCFARYSLGAMSAGSGRERPRCRLWMATTRRLAGRRS